MNRFLHILFFIISCIPFTSAQKTLPLRITKGTPVRALLDEIQESFGLNPSYDAELIESTKVSRGGTFQSVDDILFHALAFTDISYRIVGDRQLILMPRVTEQMSICGTVTNPLDNQPLPDVQVLIPGRFQDDISPWY